MALFNVIFTSFLPFIIGVLEKDIVEEVLEEVFFLACIERGFRLVSPFGSVPSSFSDLSPPCSTNPSGMACISIERSYWLIFCRQFGIRSVRLDLCPSIYFALSSSLTDIRYVPIPIVVIFFVTYFTFSAGLVSLEGRSSGLSLFMFYAGTYAILTVLAKNALITR
jgi:hypothetical protein